MPVYTCDALASLPQQEGGIPNTSSHFDSGTLRGLRDIKRWPDGPLGSYAELTPLKYFDLVSVGLPLVN